MLECRRVHPLTSSPRLRSISYGRKKLKRPQRARSLFRASACTFTYVDKQLQKDPAKHTLGGLALRPRTPCRAERVRAQAAQRYRSTAVSIRSVARTTHACQICIAKTWRQAQNGGRSRKSDVVCSMRTSQRSCGVCKNNINFDPSDIPADQPMCTPCESCHTGKPTQLVTSTLMNP